jgi:hypothetical protein
MVSLPAAVAKAAFDMIWDLFRDRKDIKPVNERPRVEDGIELHHVNTDDGSKTRPQSSASDDSNLTRRNNKKIMALPEPGDVEEAVVVSEPRALPQSPETISLFVYLKEHFNKTKLRPILNAFTAKFPTFSATLRRLPYALLPFAFSQFILVEALSYTGWIDVFSNWLAIVVGFSLPATVFFVGIMSVILCNVSGTNIGATILLVKIIKHPDFADRVDIPPKLETAGMLALAVGSNIGAVSFTFSASLAGISLE